MRNAALVGIAVGAATLLTVPQTQARVEGPWCAGYSLGIGTWVEDCSMQTFEMCRMEVIAGNRGVCSPNPRWRAYVPDQRRKRRVKSY